MMRLSQKLGTEYDQETTLRDKTFEAISFCNEMIRIQRKRKGNLISGTPLPTSGYPELSLSYRPLEVLFGTNPCCLMPNSFKRSLFMVFHPPATEMTLQHC
jgi:hypothetical protein